MARPDLNIPDIPIPKLKAPIQLLDNFRDLGGAALKAKVQSELLRSIEKQQAWKFSLIAKLDREVVIGELGLLSLEEARRLTKPGVVEELLEFAAAIMERALVAWEGYGDTFIDNMRGAMPFRTGELRRDVFVNKSTTEIPLGQFRTSAQMDRVFARLRQFANTLQIIVTAPHARAVLAERNYVARALGISVPELREIIAKAMVPRSVQAFFGGFEVD